MTEIEALILLNQGQIMNALALIIQDSIGMAGGELSDILSDRAEAAMNYVNSNYQSETKDRP